MSPLRRQLNPSSSLAAYFGWRLRHWRQRRRITQAELGSDIGYDHSHISKVEIGERCPPQDLAVRCDERLGTDGELAALWPLLAGEPGNGDAPRGHRGNPSEPSTGGTAGGATAGRAAGSTMAHLPAPRPSTGVPGGPAPSAATSLFPHPVANPPPNAGRPSDEALHAVSTLFTAYEAASGAMEPAALIPPLEDQLRQLLTWRREADRRMGAQLLELAARHAGLLGWLWFERIAHVDAVAWFEWGCGWARAAGNHELVSALHTMQAAVACWERDPTTTIDLARVAQSGPRLGAKVRALAMLAEARGGALTGAYQDSTRLLGEAGDLFAGAGTSGEPPWLSPAEAGKQLGVAEGTATLDLAVALDRADLGHLAVDKLTTTLRLDTVDGQHTILVRSRLADAYSYTGQPEAAADMMLAALRSAQSAGSPRLRHELRAVGDRLITRWPDLPAVATVDQAVREALPPAR